MVVIDLYARGEEFPRIGQLLLKVCGRILYNIESTHDVNQKEFYICLDCKCERSFEQLKRRLTTAPVLTLPEPHKPFVAFSDASKYGLGCILI